MPIDLSNVTREELMSIHNEVLRLVALQTQADLAQGGIAAAAHDSHGSNHSNNKVVTDDFRGQIAAILGRRRS